MKGKKHQRKSYLRYEHSREIIDNVKERLGIAFDKKVRELAECYDPNDWREEYFVEYVTLVIFKHISKDLAEQIYNNIINSEDETNDDIKQHMCETIVFSAISEEVVRAVYKCDKEYSNGH